MTALATVEDVQALLGRQLPSVEAQSYVERLLDLASARVRRFTRQTLTAVADDEITLPGLWGTELYLPQIPVTAITSITVDGVLVPADEYTFTPSGLVERYWRWWGTPRSSVVIIYDHGWDPIPDDIAAIVADLVAEQFRNPDQLQDESIGNYAVKYSGNQRDAKSSSIELSEGQKDLLKDFRIGTQQTSVEAPLHQPLGFRY